MQSRKLPLEVAGLMPQNTNIESVLAAEEDYEREVSGDSSTLQALRLGGARFSAQMGWWPGTASSRTFSERVRRLRSTLKPVFAGVEGKFRAPHISDDLQWLRDNVSLIYAQMVSLPAEVKPLREVPHVRSQNGEIVPRALTLPEVFLESAGYHFSDQAFAAFCQGFQEKNPLDLRELWALVPGLHLALLEQIATRGRRGLQHPATEPHGWAAFIRIRRDVTQTPWKEVLEPLILFDQILRDDPAGTYAAMDFESRNLYRDKLARIARRSDFSEIEVAREALALARQARAKEYRDPRIAARETHIGYYLIGEGRALLCQKVGCKQNLFQHLRVLLRRHPDEFFLPGIAVLTFAIITGILLWLTPPYTAPALVLLSMLILVLPSSQSAVQLMSYLVTTIFPAEILPKLDFSDEIPEDFLTLVAVPTLLLTEKQVRGLIEDLEV